MRGYLRKRVHENKIFQRSKFPKRYFAINFQHGTIKIYQTESDFKNKKCTDFKEILFRDILKVHQNLATTEDNKLASDRASKNFRMPFQIDTSERKFELFASSEEERKMWLTGFEYILVSTSEVQTIMQQEQEKKKESKLEQKKKKRETTKLINNLVGD